MKKSFKSGLFVLSFIISNLSVNAKTPGEFSNVHEKENNKGLVITINANGGNSSSMGVSNTFSFNPNLSMDYYWGVFGLGLDAGTFGTNTNFDFDNYIVPLENLDVVNISNAKTMWRSSSVLIGPSISLPLSKGVTGASLILSVKGGLTFNQAPEILVTDNVTNAKIASYSPSSDFTKNALTIKPAIFFKYWFNKNIALNVNAQYSMQTGQNEFSTGYRDISKVNLNGSSDQIRKEISSAPSIISTTKGPDKYLSFGLGISYFFRKGWDGTVKGGSANRKGWDGTVKGGSIQERGIDKKDIRKNESGQIVTLNMKIARQTQGTTFGEKVNAGRINVTLTENGCIILFPDNGFKVNTSNNSIEQLSTNDQLEFGEKVNAGLHATGSSLSQGASLLGGALPGGSIISAAVSSVGNLSGGTKGGATASSYAKTGDKKKKVVWTSGGKDDNCDGMKTLPDGDYEFECIIEQKASLKSNKTIQKRIIIEFSSVSNVLKTRHETAKNSISNVR